jgi:pimeloyl-ACP methyl ester carboxylesterase
VTIAEGEVATEEQRLRPPSLFLMLAEARGLFELNSSLLLSPLLLRAPRGDGHPVLALPGFLASDISMAPMRRYLKELGYDAHAWNMGRNLGGVASKRAALCELLRRMYQSTGRKVSLVGWSLGGVYARDLALQMPEMVRSVITLGSPFASGPKATNAWRVYELASGRRADEEDPRFGGALSGAPPVPTTAIFSRTDGICAWQGCREKTSVTSESIEVESSHCGMGHHPAVVYAVADRLAQPEGEWAPFDRSGWRGLVYPDPHR